MTRTATGLGIAAAFGFAVSLAAQTTTTPPQTTTDQRSATHSGSNREITVTGCLARGSDGMFMLNNARMDNDMNKSSSTTTASGATTTGGSSNPTTTSAGTTGTTGGSSVGTTAAEPSGHASMGGHSAMSWKLEGGKDLERHVGHTVQVTGHTDWNEHSSMSSSSSSTTTGTSGSSTTTANNGARLDVTSVKMVSSSCQ